MTTRRDMLIATAQLIGAGATLAATNARAEETNREKSQAHPSGYNPIVTLNGSTLPWKMVLA